MSALRKWLIAGLLVIVPLVIVDLLTLVVPLDEVVTDPFSPVLLLLELAVDDEVLLFKLAADKPP